ncbi:MAG: anthranilate phosphoribosyltransferase [Rubrivivax sp.]|jgi:anthranilate phosphoribosyltransferase|nr:anthranilate phosphoribosyltransferase [Rubrivivax sp.]
MSITNSDALVRLIEHREIFHDEMLTLMRRIMSGEMSPTMIAALAIGLRVKKETIGEIAAAAQVMREFATPVLVADNRHLVDIVGTGGDNSHTFNISTASTFVAAAAGARVAKHAGRSVSSTSGSADVMESLGAYIGLKPDQVTACLEETGIGFMFAPNHHTAMKHAAPVRKELGVRTIFNILGPLTNPAGAPNQLLGVFHPDLVGIQVRVLQRLGSEHVMVVYGMNGMDEISLSGETLVGELKGGEVREYVVHPSDFGLPVYDSRVLKVAGTQESVQCIQRALANEDGPVRDIVLLNAGAALYCADVAGSVAEGVRRARDAVASGAALAKLSQFVSVTNKFRPAA